MKIAQCVLPKTKIPSVLFSVAKDEVRTHENDLPLWAQIFGSSRLSAPPVWISCRQAWPHVDEFFGSELHVMLVMRSCDHCIGDGKTDFASQYRGIPVSRGDIIVLEPAIRHWLEPGKHSARAGVFVAIVWACKRRNARAFARKLVEYAGATPLEITDKRYAKWLEPMHRETHHARTSHIAGEYQS